MESLGILACETTLWVPAFYTKCFPGRGTIYLQVPEACRGQEAEAARAGGTAPEKVSLCCSLTPERSLKHHFLFLGRWEKCQHTFLCLADLSRLESRRGREERQGHVGQEG